MLESLSMYSDELMELLLSEEPVAEDLIHRIVKEAVQTQDLTPVFIGTAYRNKGVQLLLDAIVRYLPSPLERSVTAKKHDDPTQTFPLDPDPAKPFVGMAFKLVEDSFGQLTFLRIYQGTINKGEMHYNQRTDQKQRFSRIVKMHADKREEVDSAAAGDIVAVLGLDCASGDTFAAERKYCTLENMFVAEPVIKMAINPLPRRRRQDGQGLAPLPPRGSHLPRRHRRRDGRNRHRRHGRVALGYLRRAHPPRVLASRSKSALPRSATAKRPPRPPSTTSSTRSKPADRASSPTSKASSSACPRIRSTSSSSKRTSSAGRIPKEYIPSVEKGFRDSIHKGPVAEFPIVGVKAVLEDGSYHEVDSSDMAFQVCARNCFRETFLKTKPVLLEPVMKVEIEVPAQYQGPVAGELTSRRGLIVSTEVNGAFATIEGEVPLAETFGYSTDLRSMTQGQGTFTMEFAKYRRVPSNIQEEIIAEKKKRQLVGAK